jgi:hypothetical protein
MKFKPSFSSYTGIAIFGFILILVFSNIPLNILSWDTMGYQVYWTQILVHHNLNIYNLDFYQHIQETYQSTKTLYQFVSTSDGHFITRYPFGWALLNAPFILLGHLYALAFDFPIDGFSKPYQIAALFGSLFYTGLGIYWFRKVLLHFFSEKTTGFVLIAVLLGTNYLNINYMTIGLVHVYLFTLYAGLLLQTIKFHQSYQLKNALFIGLFIGLLIATRPTEIVAVFIPLLWNVGSFSELLKRIKIIFTTQFKLYLPAVLIALVCIFPQLLYWKLTTGSWVFYSYVNGGEGLDLLSPHTLNFLLSFRKGWWLYTPMMFFATLGFYQIYQKQKPIFWALFSYFIFNLYLVSSWTTWWYASSFSQRAIEQSYPIMGITLGFFFVYQVKWRKWMLTFASIFIFLNLFQTYQYHVQILPDDRITKEYYLSVFGQVRGPSKEQLKLLSIDREQTVFINEDQYVKVKTIHYKGQKPLMMSQQQNMYTKNIRIPYDQLTSKDHVWIRGYGIVEAQSNLEKTGLNFTMAMFHKDNPYMWHAISMRKDTNRVFKKDTLIFDYLTPEIRTKRDELSVGFWHQYGDSVLLHDFFIEVWEPKK